MTYDAETLAKLNKIGAAIAAEIDVAMGVAEAAAPMQGAIDYLMSLPGVTAVHYREADETFEIQVMPPLEWITIDFSMPLVTGAEAS